MQKSVIIVGGGAAGLSAGVALSSRGHKVSLFEARPFAGGRIFSFQDPVTKDMVDNGQHVMTGFYYNTMKLLSAIGSSDHVARQRRLSVTFAKKGGGYVEFSAPNLPSPLHFLAGLLRFPFFSVTDVFKLAWKRHLLSKPAAPGSTAFDLLDGLGLSEVAIGEFFRPLALATLNSELTQVSAELFRAMLRTMLGSPSKDSVLLYSTAPLSDLIAEPCCAHILSFRGEIFLSRQIERLEIKNGTVAAAYDQFRNKHIADAYILALPPDALREILPGTLVAGLDRWTYSPIVSVNIWYERPVVDKLMAGFIGSRFHWCFDKASIIKGREGHPYIILLISAANSEMTMAREELASLAVAEMKKYFRAAADAKVVHTQVIKERKATVLLTPSLAGLRPGSDIGLKNCFLAGDWTDTGLPATMESAVKSGFTAAEMV